MGGGAPAVGCYITKSRSGEIRMEGRKDSENCLCPTQCASWRIMVERKHCAMRKGSERLWERVNGILNPHQEVKSPEMKVT